jgi:hypothetical protein
MPRIRATVLAAILVAAAACGMDRPTTPLMPPDAPLFAKKNATPVISDVSPSTASLTITATPDVTVPSSFTVAVANPAANAIVAGLSIAATIVQGNASRDAGSATPDCGDGPGVLRPNTGCAVPITVTANNSANGTGTLTPGNAKLVFSLVQSNGTTVTTLDTKTIKVTLTGVVYMSDLQLHFSSMQIDGTELNAYTMSLANTTGQDQSLYVVQAYVEQGDVVHAAGGANVCPGLTGIVPPGGCTFDWHASAQNSVIGQTGTLVAGPAILRIELIHFDGVSNVVVAGGEFAITLTGP